MSRGAIHVDRISKRYRIWTHHRPTNLKERLALAVDPGRKQRPPLRDEIWALKDVSFDVAPGEVFGVVGANGAGKSTLFAVLARITDPTSGRAVIHGRVSTLLEVGTGFHPELSGRDNIYLNGAVLGMSRAETRRKFDEIVEFSEIGDLVEMPVKRYSSGMYMRLAFAVAAHLDPEILLLDEVLSVGDAAFQHKSLARIHEMARSRCTVLFVSHSTHSVRQLCDRAIYLEKGRAEFVGGVDEALERYLGNRAVLLGGGRLDRAQRDGTGEVRILEVRVANGDGGSEVAVDQPVRITVELEPRRIPETAVELELTVSSPVAGDLVSLSTRLSPHSFEQPSRRIECTLDELPLKPGTYLLSAAVTRMHEVLDRVENQVEFQLLPGDDFSLDATSGDHGAPVVVRHRWTAREPVAPETR